MSPDEYGDFYERYINKSRGQHLINLLENGFEQTTGLLGELDDQQARFRYAEDKWTIKEVVGHMTDTERIMGFRALTFARGDSHELPGFDQDSYVEAANFNDVELKDLLKEYSVVRSSTIQLFSSFTDNMLSAIGIASGAEFSVRALGYVIAGHEIHHLDIFKEKYLPGIFSS